MQPTYYLPRITTLEILEFLHDGKNNEYCSLDQTKETTKGHRRGHATFNKQKHYNNALKKCIYLSNI